MMTCVLSLFVIQKEMLIRLNVQCYEINKELGKCKMILNFIPTIEFFAQYFAFVFILSEWI